jgi:hypothetical protein
MSASSPPEGNKVNKVSKRQWTFDAEQGPDYKPPPKKPLDRQLIHAILQQVCQRINLRLTRLETSDKMTRTMLDDCKQQLKDPKRKVLTLLNEEDPSNLTDVIRHYFALAKGVVFDADDLASFSSIVDKENEDDEQAADKHYIEELPIFVQNEADPHGWTEAGHEGEDYVYTETTVRREYHVADHTSHHKRHNTCPSEYEELYEVDQYQLEDLAYGNKHHVEGMNHSSRYDSRFSSRKKEKGFDLLGLQKINYLEIESIASKQALDILKKKNLVKLRPDEKRDAINESVSRLYGMAIGKDSNFIGNAPPSGYKTLSHQTIGKSNLKNYSSSGRKAHPLSNQKPIGKVVSEKVHGAKKTGLVANHGPSSKTFMKSGNSSLRKDPVEPSIETCNHIHDDIAFSSPLKCRGHTHNPITRSRSPLPPPSQPGSSQKYQSPSLQQQQQLSQTYRQLGHKSSNSQQGISPIKANHAVTMPAAYGNQMRVEAHAHDKYKSGGKVVEVRSSTKGDRDGVTDPANGVKQNSTGAKRGSFINLTDYVSEDFENNQFESEEVDPGQHNPLVKPVMIKHQKESPAKPLQKDGPISIADPVTPHFSAPNSSPKKPAQTKEPHPQSTSATKQNTNHSEPETAPKPYRPLGVKKPDVKQINISSTEMKTTSKIETKNSNISQKVNESPQNSQPSLPHTKPLENSGPLQTIEEEKPSAFSLPNSGLVSKEGSPEHRKLDVSPTEVEEVTRVTQETFEKEILPKDENLLRQQQAILQSELPPSQVKKDSGTFDQPTTQFFDSQIEKEDPQAQNVNQVAGNFSPEEDDEMMFEDDDDDVNEGIIKSRAQSRRQSQLQQSSIGGEVNVHKVVTKTEEVIHERTITVTHPGKEPEVSKEIHHTVKKTEEESTLPSSTHQAELSKPLPPWEVPIAGKMSSQDQPNPNTDSRPLPPWEVQPTTKQSSETPPPPPWDIETEKQNTSPLTSSQTQETIESKPAPPWGTPALSPSVQQGETHDTSNETSVPIPPGWNVPVQPLQSLPVSSPFQDLPIAPESTATSKSQEDDDYRL